MNRQLPPFLEELLGACPKSGEGVHAWLFRVARQLHAHLPAVEIVVLLERASAHCGRPVPRSEITAAVQNSILCAWQPNDRSGGSSNISAPKWPVVNQEQREAIIRDGVGLVDLWEASPVRFESNDTHTEALIDRLFPGDPLLCCGLSSARFETRSRSEWRGSLTRLQLIVPNPMTARSGPTKQGKESAHSLSITGPRWFFVIEQDQGAIDEQVAVLLHLASRAPLVLAVHSGIKSIHGWFYCIGQPEEKLRSFMRYAVSLGACHSTWSRSQFVRMPDGLRDNGKRQVVYYFNPELIK